MNQTEDPTRDTRFEASQTGPKLHSLTRSLTPGASRTRISPKEQTDEKRSKQQDRRRFDHTSLFCFILSVSPSLPLSSFISVSFFYPISFTPHDIFFSFLFSISLFPPALCLCFILFNYFLFKFSCYIFSSSIIYLFLHFI